MSTNPFQSTDPWEVALDTALPQGNHVCKITEAEGGTSSGSHPEIRLKVENQEGSLRDWLQITQGTVSKVVALADAAGIERPGDGDFDPETLRVHDEWIYRLVGKTVGVVAREEPAYDSATGREDPTKKRVRIKGYVVPQKIAQSVANGAGAFQHSPAAVGEKDIPFAPSVI
jgi:hypothetical protein